MITTAVPAGEPRPALFVLDLRDRTPTATASRQVVAEWDGAGMWATQSHAVHLERSPAVRLAWDGTVEELMRWTGPFLSLLFTATVLGVFDEAMGAARDRQRDRSEELRAFERVEWARADLDHWLAVQAYEGALRAVTSSEQVAAAHGALRAKVAVAELAEQSLLRLSRVLGGGTFSRRSSFAHWFEDVRALGFLRPPWALAYDSLFATSM
jgi:hypothetical protein